MDIIVEYPPVDATPDLGVAKDQTLFGRGLTGPTIGFMIR
jgi:hypothetical protein